MWGGRLCVWEGEGGGGVAHLPAEAVHPRQEAKSNVVRDAKSRAGFSERPAVDDGRGQGMHGGGAQHGRLKHEHLRGPNDHDTVKKRNTHTHTHESKYAEIRYVFFLFFFLRIELRTRAQKRCGHSRRRTTYRPGLKRVLSFLFPHSFLLLFLSLSPWSLVCPPLFTLTFGLAQVKPCQPLPSGFVEPACSRP